MGYEVLNLFSQIAAFIWKIGPIDFFLYVVIVANDFPVVRITIAKVAAERHFLQTKITLEGFDDALQNIRCSPPERHLA